MNVLVSNLNRITLEPLSPDFSLETALERVRDIQTLLQNGQLPFEKSLTLYEEAERLIKQSQAYLSQAELRIQQLSEE